MTKQIIPTILVKTFKEVKEKIKAVENYVDWIQLDIMDGVFVGNKTWPYAEGKISDLKKISACGRPAVGWKTKVKLEAHLMVQNPEKVIDKWLKNVDRVIVHFESKIEDLENLIKKVHSHKKQIGLAINPETNCRVIAPFLEKIDLVLFMSVRPGLGGQVFEPEVLDKIKALREIWPKGDIGVDGGVNDKNAGKIFAAGANLLCVGNYIFKSENIKQTIEKFK
ncbi:ribulose-phosphate 3-epimerase [Patescibacteria group bacterium]|nr:ribulose-phosphate 3-epimerase [Patescibacteria group bacterium]MBU4458777.1 ribulose-phosphate 3-epimerase [Patescibacteria group bacterium]MCG2696195.1 ribulose-phosphate 3-epimerase [Candidatus Portnoybacteria bacterium]